MTVIPTETTNRVISYREAIREALALELERDPDVFIMGEDIGDYGGVFKVTSGLKERFGAERVRDTPIAEAGFVGTAIGAAMMGKRPIVELMFMDFVLVAADQLLNQAAKMRYISGDQFRVPLTVRTQEGVVGGGAQHSQCLEALFMHVPGFAVALPSTPADAKGLLTTAIRSDDPVLVIEHRALYAEQGTVPEGEHLVPFGRAAVLREGSDVSIVAYSRGVEIARAAADLLEAEGVSPELIDLRTIVPIDWETLVTSVEKTGRAVIVHEGHRAAGVGAEIAAQLSEMAWDHLDAPVARLCGRDFPIPYSERLEEAWLPAPHEVVAAIHGLS